MARTNTPSPSARLLAAVAVEDLEFELARAQLAHARMRAADKLLRHGDDLGLAALGFSPQHIEALRSVATTPDGGYPMYALRAIEGQIRWLRTEVCRRHSSPTGIEAQVLQAESGSLNEILCRESLQVQRRDRRLGPSPRLPSA